MKKLPYVQSFDGYNYLRYRQQPRVRLPDGSTATPAFKAAYKAALAAAKAQDKPTPPTPRRKKKLPTSGGTIRDAVDSYMRSPAWAKLKGGTQVGRRYLLQSWAEQYGDEVLGELTPKAMRGMLYLRSATPGAAHNWLVAVRGLVQDRLAAGEIEEDPTAGLKSPRSNNPDGYLPWEPEHLSLYRSYWASGTVQRLALEVLYWTGAACCDAVKLTRENISEGLVQFERQKTGAPSFPGFAAELEREIAACVVAPIEGPILRTEQGLAFGAHYFSARFAKWARQAGVPAGYSAHGVRKRAATDDAEAGRTTTQLKAKYGWTTSDQPDHYTRSADMKRVALAMAKSA
jgi:hypothetical protein